MKSNEPIVAGGGWRTPHSLKRRLYGSLAIVGLVLTIVATCLLYSYDQMRGLHLVWLCIPLALVEILLIVQVVRCDSAEKRELVKTKAPPPYKVRNLY